MILSLLKCTTCTWKIWTQTDFDPQRILFKLPLKRFFSCPTRKSAANFTYPGSFSTFQYKQSNEYVGVWKPIKSPLIYHLGLHCNNESWFSKHWEYFLYAVVCLLQVWMPQPFREPRQGFPAISTILWPRWRESRPQLRESPRGSPLVSPRASPLATPPGQGSHQHPTPRRWAGRPATLPEVSVAAWTIGWVYSDVVL